MRALPVLNDKNTLEGVISFFHLGRFFIPKPRTLKKCAGYTQASPPSYARLMRKFSHGEKDDLEELYVRIGAMDIRSFSQHHKRKAQPQKTALSSLVTAGIFRSAASNGVRLLVITGGLDVDPEVIQHAREAGVSLIVGPYDSASTAWIIRTATYIDRLIRTEVSCFAPARPDPYD